MQQKSQKSFIKHWESNTTVGLNGDACKKLGNAGALSMESQCILIHFGFSELFSMSLCVVDVVEDR